MMNLRRKVVVGIGREDEMNEKLVKIGCYIAQGTNRPLMIFHVYDPDTEVQIGDKRKQKEGHHLTEMEETIIESNKYKEESHLNWVKSKVPENIELSTRFLEGNVSELISAVAIQEQAYLLILGVSSHYSPVTPKDFPVSLEAIMKTLIPILAVPDSFNDIDFDKNIHALAIEDEMKDNSHLVFAAKLLIDLGGGTIVGIHQESSRAAKVIDKILSISQVGSHHHAPSQRIKLFAKIKKIMNNRIDSIIEKYSNHSILKRRSMVVQDSLNNAVISVMKKFSADILVARKDSFLKAKPGLSTGLPLRKIGSFGIPVLVVPSSKPGVRL